MNLIESKNSIDLICYPLFFRSNICNDWSHLLSCNYDFSFCHFQPIRQFPTILPNLHSILCSPSWTLFPCPSSNFQRFFQRTLWHSYILDCLCGNKFEINVLKNILVFSFYFLIVQHSDNSRNSQIPSNLQKSKFLCHKNSTASQT